MHVNGIINDWYNFKKLFLMWEMKREHHGQENDMIIERDGDEETQHAEGC